MTTIDFEDILEIETGEAEVTFEGILRPIPRKPWVGPGVRAMVTSATQVPWDRYKILCSHCKEVVHKVWECKKENNCYRCKNNSHLASECPYCQVYRKYGHEREWNKGGQEAQMGVERQPLP